MDQPYVIAISAVSGGGKTAVSQRLVKQLPNAKAIYFDDFDLRGPDDISAWVKSGGDPHIWDLTPFVESFNRLRAELPGFIVLDYPFLYGHRQMSELINLAVFIDTPLDIAMARRIIRDHEGHLGADIIEEMRYYLSRARLAYLDMLRTIKPQADLVVDGALPLLDVVKIIGERLRIEHFFM